MNPRNSQELLDMQFPSDEERQRRLDAQNAYADSCIRREKAHAVRVNDIGAGRGDDWLFQGRTGR